MVRVGCRPHTPIDAHLLQKAGPVPQPGSWPSPGRGSGDTVDPGSPAGPAVNHLLGVSLCPIGCLGPQPSGLKPRVGGSSPVSVRPMSWGNGLMLLASEMGGPRDAPPAPPPRLRRATSTLPSGSPSLKEETILALTGTPSWQEAGLSHSWGEGLEGAYI